MPIHIQNDGLDQLGRMLANIANEAQNIASGALFDGAGVIADALHSGIDSIQTETFSYAAGGKKRKPSPQEKAALQRKVGISRFRKNGSEVDTLIGICYDSGYTQIAGKQKPVAVIARSINSGTSFMEKQPVFRKAVTKSRHKAEQAMVDKANELIEKLTK